MTLIIMIVCVAFGIAVLGAIVWALLMYPHLPTIERLTLSVLGGGVLWGGLSRATGHGLALGDVLLLIGLAGLLWRFYIRNPKIGVDA